MSFNGGWWFVIYGEHSWNFIHTEICGTMIQTQIALQFLQGSIGESSVVSNPAHLSHGYFSFLWCSKLNPVSYRFFCFADGWFVNSHLFCPNCLQYEGLVINGRKYEDLIEFNTKDKQRYGTMMITTSLEILGIIWERSRWDLKICNILKGFLSKKGSRQQRHEYDCVATKMSRQFKLYAERLRSRRASKTTGTIKSLQRCWKTQTTLTHSFARIRRTMITNSIK